MRFVCCLVLTLAPALARAQSPAPLTVDAAVSAAVSRNPRLSAAARDIAAARAGVRAARSLANPSLTFTPGLTSAGGSDEELLFQQPLELNGARSARAGVANAQLRQSQAEAVVELRTLVFQTRSAYYELARARALNAVAEESLRTAEEFEQITRRQVEVGTRPGIDRIQAAGETSRARQQHLQAEARVAAASLALSTLLGRATTDPVEELQPLTFTPDAKPVEEAVRGALAARTEITAEEARRDAFGQEARLERAQGRPDLVPQLRAGSVTRGLSDAGVGLGITLPFLDYGGRRNRIRQAEESARAQADRVEERRRQVRLEVEQALARLRGTEAVLRDFQGGALEQARVLLDGSRKGLEAGLTTVVAVLEAQRSYRMVLSDYTNALAEHALALAELERATGAVPASLLPAVSREGSAK